MRSGYLRCHVVCNLVVLYTALGGGVARWNVKTLKPRKDRQQRSREYPNKEVTKHALSKVVRHMPIARQRCFHESRIRRSHAMSYIIIGKLHSDSDSASSAHFPPFYHNKALVALVIPVWFQTTVVCQCRQLCHHESSAFFFSTKLPPPSPLCTLFYHLTLLVSHHPFTALPSHRSRLNRVSTSSGQSY